VELRGEKISTSGKINIQCVGEENFFKGFQIILISSWYRSMWTIGRSQHVEEKNIDLSSVKYGISKSGKNKKNSI
jgi:hypothetical protein